MARAVSTWALVRQNGLSSPLHSSSLGSKPQVVGSSRTPSFTPSFASQAAMTELWSAINLPGGRKLASVLCVACATHTDCRERPVQSKPGDPAMMPSKSDGYRWASISAERPPAEHPVQYESLMGCA